MLAYKRELFYESLVRTKCTHYKTHALTVINQAFTAIKPNIFTLALACKSLLILWFCSNSCLSSLCFELIGLNMQFFS